MELLICPAYLLDALAVDGPAGEVAELLEAGTGLQDGREGVDGQVRGLVHVEALQTHPERPNISVEEPQGESFGTGARFQRWNS